MNNELKRIVTKAAQYDLILDLIGLYLPREINDEEFGQKVVEISDPSDEKTDTQIAERIKEFEERLKPYKLCSTYIL